MNLVSQNIYQDPFATIPVKVHWTRSNIYKKSDVISEYTDGEVVEISGHVSLEDKFHLWNTHGKPQEFLYFSIQKGEVCKLSDIANEEDSINWCIGWIAEDKVAFIFVDFINILIDYYYQDQARNLDRVSEPVAS